MDLAQELNFFQDENEHAGIFLSYLNVLMNLQRIPKFSSS